jgi:thioredoxin reductase
VELFRKQLENTGVEVRFEKVLELEYRDELFSAKTDRRVIRSNITVIATGTKPKEIPGLPLLDGIKDRIFHEVYPIQGVENKKIVIIGAGDAAFDYALSLSQKNEVLILNRSKQDKCIPVLRERCMKCESISYLGGVRVREINERGKGLRLTYDDDNQDGNQIYADYVLIAVGREPCLDFLGNQLKRDLAKLIKMGTLYSVGDVKNEVYRQTAICVGDGVRSAMKICRKLRGEDT